MVVCVCKGTSERQVHEAIGNGATTLEALAAELDGAGQDCGCCLVELRSLLDGGRGDSHIRCSTEERPPEP